MERTNPANVEHASNVYTLLAEIYAQKSDARKALASWIMVIGIHSQFPHLWEKLAPLWSKLGDETTAKLCLSRAESLHASVQGSLPDSFVMTHQDKEFVDLASSKERARKEAEMKQRFVDKSIGHPPFWLRDEAKLVEFLQSFVLNLANVA